MEDKELIRKVQAALISRGYDLGPAGADGDKGRKTFAAIAKFQADQNLPIKYPGSIGPITLGALGIDDDVDLSPASPKTFNAIVPPWYAKALEKRGLHEATHSKKLKEFLKSDGRTLGDPAKLPWCGDFVETCIALALPNEPMVVNPYWARNWSKFGIDPGGVPLGAVVNFERGSGGHVGFVAGHDKTYVHVLGGNQSNAITIAKLAKSRLLSIRWPSTYPLPAKFLQFSTFNGTISTNEA